MQKYPVVLKIRARLRHALLFGGAVAFFVMPDQFVTECTNHGWHIAAAIPENSGSLMDVFPGLTVEQNLETGTISWHGFFGRKPYNKDLEEVYDLFPRLKERRNQDAWSLSGGEQQMLAIGRAIMARPKLLMLDEPSMGLAPLIIEELFEKIVQINKGGVPILLVEQNARMALDVSHQAYVIDSGKIVLSGESSMLKNDPRVIKAYFGSLGEKAAKSRQE